MTIAAAIFLIAVGAILKYATDFNVQNVDMDTVGLILMIAGAAGLILSLLQEAIWSRRRGAVVEQPVQPVQPVAPVQQQQYVDPNAPPPPPPPEQRY